MRVGSPVRALLVALVVVGSCSALTITVSAPLGATTTTSDPGLLPQTSVEPSTKSPLTTQLDVLWRAIVSNNPVLAQKVFFPRTAYLRMKSGLLANPSEDYSSRLLAFFSLDVAAYHRLVTSTHTVLLGVNLNSADAAWIAPRDCENLIGYWHLPGVRLVYRSGSEVRSFAIDSLISWRGVWYVVHLGPNPRATDVGTVDRPQAGRGLAGPPGGC